MAKRKYSPEDRKLVRRLLLLHGGNVPLVHQLTGFPVRTIHNWRAQWDDDYELYTDALARSYFARANAKTAVQSPVSLATAGDTASAHGQNSLAQYTQLRDKLMNHAMTLADNLLLGDGFINQRVQALSRLLDRILVLDDILPDKQPEKTIRFEYYYDNAVQEHPPWKGASEGFDRSLQSYGVWEALGEDPPEQKPFPASRSDAEHSNPITGAHPDDSAEQISPLSLSCRRSPRHHAAGRAK